MTITRIEPRKRFSVLQWREICDYKDFLYFLALRDIQLRYKQTALGVVWVILQPLIPSVVFAILFGNFAKLPSDGQPYILLVMCGMVPWNIFSNALSRAGSSVVGNAGLMSKVFFPRVIVPLASLGSVVLDALVGCGVLFILCLLFQSTAGAQLLLAPFFLLLALCMGLGLSLVITSLSVYFRDFNYLLPFVLQVWNYVTPVVYSSDLIPEKWRFLYFLNPLAGVVEGFRWSVLGGATNITPGIVAYSATATAAILLIGLCAFLRTERGFADVV